MLVISGGGGGKEIRIANYTWDAGLKDFKCELRDVDVGLIAEAVKDGPIDIFIKSNDTIIKFLHFVYELWDNEGDNVKIEGRYWG